MDSLSQAWDKSTTFPKPTILYGFYKGKWYITLEDSKSIFFFMSKEKQVYAVVSFKCDPMTLDTGIKYYNIPENEALQIISCTIPFSDLSRYAVANIHNQITWP